MTVLQNKFSKNSEKILRLEKCSCCPGQGGRKMTVLQQIFENLSSLPARKFKILKIYRFYPASKIFLAVQKEGIEKTDQWRRQGSSELVGTEAPKLIFYVCDCTNTVKKYSTAAAAALLYFNFVYDSIIFINYFYTTLTNSV